MNAKPLLVARARRRGAGGALARAALDPAARRPRDDPALTALLNDVTAQQATIAENQAKIDAKLAAIAENVRLARIFVGRGGGKAAMKTLHSPSAHRAVALLALAVNLHSQAPRQAPEQPPLQTSSRRSRRKNQRR